MLRRITLENFMAHGRTVIDLAGGLTVLVGPNNCGKSAVVEALRTLCSNENAEHLVRHGEKQCTITVETDDGHVIAWKRKGPTVWYEIDGKPQHRLKGATPDDLHELLKLPKVRTPRGEGFDTFDVHFGLQKAPIFLLDEDACERKAAAFFAASSDAEKLMEMQQKHREKVRNAKAAQKELAEELTRSEQILGTLAPLDELSPALQRAELAHELIQKESAEIRRLAECVDGLERQQRTLRRHERHCVTLGGLQPPPAPGDEAALARLLRGVEAAMTGAAHASLVGEAVRVMTTPPELSDAAALEKLAAGVERAHLEHHRSARVTGVMSALREPPLTEDVAALVAVGQSLRAAGRQREALHRQRDALAALSAPPEPCDPSPVESLVAQWTENRRLARQHAVDACELGEQLDDVEKRLRAWVEANPTCPVCGGAIDPEQVISSGGHAHVG